MVPRALYPVCISDQLLIYYLQTCSDAALEGSDGLLVDDRLEPVSPRLRVASAAIRQTVAGVKVCASTLLTLHIHRFNTNPINFLPKNSLHI